MTTKILLVDDHRMMREGLRALIEQQEQLEVVGEAGDGRAALARASELRPDVVVMDVGLPDLNGIEATRLLLKELPGVKVIALSMHADRRYVVAMLKAGAIAYLLKNSAADELIRAIAAAVAGQAFLSPEIAATVVRRIAESSEKPAASAFAELSARQREVLQLLAEGKSSKQIGHELGMAVKTVETHRRQIMLRLDLHSVAELTKYAIRQGLTPLDG